MVQGMVKHFRFGCSVMRLEGFRLGYLAECIAKRLLKENGFEVHQFRWVLSERRTRRQREFRKWFSKEIRHSYFSGLGCYAIKDGKEYFVEVKSSRQMSLNRLKKKSILISKNQEKIFSKAKELGFIPLIVYITLEFSVKEWEIVEWTQSTE